GVAPRSEVAPEDPDFAEERLGHRFLPFSTARRVEYDGYAGRVYDESTPEDERRGMDRREFLKGSTAAGVAIGLSPRLIAGTSAMGGETLSQADYEALRNSWFHVGSPEEGWQSLELVNVRDDGSNARAEQWSVFFRGDPGTELSEGVHTLVPPD